MTSDAKQIVVLGATGSIGVSTLDVVARHPDRYRVLALTANRNHGLLQRQVLQHRPKYVVLKDPDAAMLLKRALATADVSVEVLVGEQALIQVAGHPDADYVMAAIVGAAGLLPTLAAVQAGKRVLLANKESLVMSGSLFMQAVTENEARLLPIDSEHNAIYQCLPTMHREGLSSIGVRKLLLTASGGPFRDRPLATLDKVTPDQACAHPNWSMGRKISVDSATMMNKGLELIEACWLFNTAARDVEVLIHRQSIIHSMVEYQDGSVLAQLGNPDMRTPIAYGLAWPDRIESGVASLELARLGSLDFEALDDNRFPCVGLAVAAIEAGGTSAAALNAANEVAVEAFLQGRIRFTAIAQVIDQVLQQYQSQSAESIELILEEDRRVRRLAQHAVHGLR